MNKILLIIIGTLLHISIRAQDLGGDTVIKPRLRVKYLAADSQERKAVLLRPATEPTFTLSGQSLKPVSVQLNSELNKDFASLAIGVPTSLIGKLLYTRPKLQVSLQSDLFRNKSVQDFTRQEVSVRTQNEYMNYKVSLAGGISYDQYAQRKLDPVRWTSFHTRASLSPKQDNWAVNLNFVNTENQNNQEVWIEPSVSYAKSLKDWKMKLDSRISNSNTQFQNRSFGNTSFMLGGKIFQSQEGIYKQAGLGMFATNAGVYLLPDILYRRKIKENLVLQFQSVSTQQHNALIQVLRANPYVQKIPKFTPTILYDHRVKVETNYKSNYAIYAGLGWQRFRNMLQYLWTEREGMEMQIATLRNAIVSDIGLRYSSSIHDYLDVKFQNNQWLGANTNWSLPTWIMKAECSKRLRDRIILRSDLMAMSRRKGGILDNGEQSLLKEALVGNIQGYYQLNKRWRASVQVENFTNSKAKIWDGYPVLPFRVLLGGYCALD